MEEIGRTLYEIYLKKFQTAFAPTWDELSEFSKVGWSNTAKEFLERSNGAL